MIIVIIGASGAMKEKERSSICWRIALTSCRGIRAGTMPVIAFM